MSRRIAMSAVLLISMLGALVPAVAAAGPTLPLPTIMAAVGDSISQAASTGGSLGVDYPQNSWATGTNTTVNSHYLRLLAAGAPISGHNINLAVSGSKAIDLNAQMANVVALATKPDYLTVQIGGNDLCTDTFAAMTSVTDFRAQFQSAMQTLKDGSPNTNVYVVSIPDAYQLWSLFKSNWYARFIWSVGGVCQSLLANPTSTTAADVQRRADVRQRNQDYNTQLRQVCTSAAFAAHCLFDNNAVFNVQFAKSDVAGDYFHPSIAGQTKLASASWAAGYSWSSAPPAPNVAPTAAFSYSCTGLACSFTDASTDSDGSIASRSWDFGDLTAASTATNPSHTYASGGTFIVGLTVTDNIGATGVTSVPVIVIAPPQILNMRVSQLETSTSTSRKNWSATVIVHVVDPNNAAVSGVAVTSSWSSGSGTTTCTTDGFGTCLLTSGTLNGKTSSVTFTVGNLTKAGWLYTAPVGGDFVTINKPAP